MCSHLFFLAVSADTRSPSLSYFFPTKHCPLWLIWHDLGSRLLLWVGKCFGWISPSLPVVGDELDQEQCWSSVWPLWGQDQWKVLKQGRSGFQQSFFYTFHPEASFKDRAFIYVLSCSNYSCKNIIQHLEDHRLSPGFYWQPLCFCCSLFH